MSNASLITDLINIEYLTGFRSSNAFLLLTKKENWLFTDGRYLEKAQNIAAAKKAHIGNFEVIDMTKNLKEILSNWIAKYKIDAIDYEAENLSMKRFEQFKKVFKAPQRKLKWREGNQHTEHQRAMKDTLEIKNLKKSQAINEQIFYSTRAHLKPGVTEIKIAQHIKQLAFEYGADDISFEPIIAFGNHSSMPHHENTKRKLQKGEVVLIDMGVRYKRYASDMTRMVFTKTPTREEEEIYNLVLEAQEAAIEKMKPGIECKKLDQIARDLLKKEGHEKNFTHSLGHGIGLEVHESPTLSTRSKEKLKTGMVVTSEPGIYLPGKFGVRIEDMILITKKGRENLTQAPKQLSHCILR